MREWFTARAKALYDWLWGNRFVVVVAAFVLIAVPTVFAVFSALTVRLPQNDRIAIMVGWLIAAAFASGCPPWRSGLVQESPPSPHEGRLEHRPDLLASCSVDAFSQEVGMSRVPGVLTK